MNMQASEQNIAKIALADGMVLTGVSKGYRGETSGELCFNTSMTGYQEISSDPSYYGQIMMMTYPHIGNYGASEEDMEARRPMIAGLVVRSFADEYSNQRADESLASYLKRHHLVCISEVDTRLLVRHIRSKGVMNAVISAIDLDDESLVSKAQRVPSMVGQELASKVSTKEIYDFSSGQGNRIAVYDFGVKQNILRMFQSRNCSVRVFPADTSLATVLDWKPEGIFFSNGPGDPRAMPETVQLVKEVTTMNIPMFGICLGHQLMSLSQGIDVYKMFVGHRGANHPVKYLKTGHVEITTQNHGFAVDASSINEHVASITHVNLNDQTIEGVRFKSFTGFSVQYHPEASPGPHDSRYLFEIFMSDIAKSKEFQTK